MLHAALESRLAALEAALANPDDCALEDLILDLARTATEDAEAVARQASALARAEADSQAGTALTQAHEAEAALSSERQAGLTLHRSLGAARSELEAAKQKIAALTNDLEHMRDAFSIERSTLRAELSEAERCFAAADTLRQQAEAARHEEVARERATVQRLTDVLSQARNEVDAARQEVASRAADMEAARERADVASRAQADLTQALNEARARIEAAGQERDRLMSELEAARHNAATSATAVQSADAERATLEQKWHDAEARAAALTREREGLLADRDATKSQLDAARQGVTTAAAALRAIDSQRVALDQRLRDVEARAKAVTRERDGLIAERDAAQARLDAIAVERDAAKTQLDAIAAERDAAKTQLDAIVAERDAAQAQREAAEAARDAAVAQLEAARQGSTTATAAIQSLDAHRATLEQNWQNAEARAQAMTDERDAAIAQRDAAIAERETALTNVEALRKTVDEAKDKDRARFSELRQRTERQIQDLEKQLLGAADSLVEDGPEINVSLDDIDDGAGDAIDIDEPVVVAAKPKAASKPARAATAPPPADPPQPVRAASRHAFREPLEVKLDGQSAQLVDISTAGAQVLSNSALKPNKPVKMLLPSSEAIILCKARIVWSRFEPPTPGKPVRYRAGMAFTQADIAALQIFITRHTGVKMTAAAPAEERKTGRLISVPFNNANRAEEGTRRSREPIASIDFNFPTRRD